MAIIDEVRLPLLEEARNSPTLLSDLAGLEQYIAESYDARSFVELLQNADDAGAARFAIQRVGDSLLVANDGRHFTRPDFESLCRSAASSKERGTSIGYRGIGFKSVVGFAQTVHIFSGELEVTFSRERTATEVPEATRVPLIRIPHSVDESQRRQIATALDRMTQEGFHTVFAFTDLLASGIEAEFSAFDPTSLLFLRNIRQVELRTNVEEVITARREAVNTQVNSIRLASSVGTSLWEVVERDGVALAFAKEEKVVPLKESEAVVHAFLPTHEKTGLSIKVNGDISTDPSRTRVVMDERTASGIESIASLIVDIIADSLGEEQGFLPGTGTIAALIPLSDPRTASFQRRSFRTDLLAAIQRSAEGLFKDLRYCPSWLNPVDFEKLAKASKIRPLGRDFENIEGLSGFLRFLGAREATLEELSLGLKVTTPSTPGAAEVVSHITKLHTTKQIAPSEVEAEWRIWPVDEEPTTFSEAKDSAKPFDRSFVDMVSEKAGAGSELPRLVSNLSDVSTAAKMLPDTQESAPQLAEVAATEPQRNDDSSAAPQRLSLKKWRSAEQQVLSLLDLKGWNVNDVSRQNLGYDIEGLTPEGTEVCIEVKAIDNPGQAFTLTSNEEAVARQKGGSYRLAIVRQSGAYLEIAFIKDPANQLPLTRQCRQWVWECSSYDFTPDRFLLD